jgi:hypothetical protein
MDHRTDNQGHGVYQSQKIYLTPTTDGSISYFGVTEQLDSPPMLHADGRTASAFRVDISGLPVGNHAKVSITRRWMKLQDVQLKANFATFSQSAIPGENLLTFSGSHAKVSNYRSITGLAD